DGALEGRVSRSRPRDPRQGARGAGLRGGAKATVAGSRDPSPAARLYADGPTDPEDRWPSPIPLAHSFTGAIPTNSGPAGYQTGSGRDWTNMSRHGPGNATRGQPSAGGRIPGGEWRCAGTMDAVRRPRCAPGQAPNPISTKPGGPSHDTDEFPAEQR